MLLRSRKGDAFFFQSLGQRHSAHRACVNADVSNQLQDLEDVIFADAKLERAPDMHTNSVGIELRKASVQRQHDERSRWRI